MKYIDFEHVLAKWKVSFGVGLSVNKTEPDQTVTPCQEPGGFFVNKPEPDQTVTPCQETKTLTERCGLGGTSKVFLQLLMSHYDINVLTPSPLLLKVTLVNKY